MSSAAERPEPSPPGVDASTVDELLALLSDSKMLDAFEITDEDLLHARDDSDLLETLRIAHEVLAELRASGVFDVFLQLPETDQAQFLRTIGMTDDRELRHHRTQSFVSALQDSPLGGG